MGKQFDQIFLQQEELEEMPIWVKQMCFLTHFKVKKEQ